MWRALIAAALLVTATGCGGPPRPNIVVILTDDAGYSDPGCYGGEMSTPNIDALARGGIRFSKFYTNARCSPTRASLMTGMYPHRVGVGELCGRTNRTPFPGYKGRMARDVVTVAEALRGAGYHTLMAGKWHLGGGRKEASAYRPRARGFDRHFGKLGGGSSYFEFGNYRLDDAPYVHDASDSFYATRATSDHAVRFVREARARDRRPFFLYVAYNAPHAPHEVPETDLEEQAHLYEGGVWEAVRRSRYEGLLREGLIDERWVYKPLSPGHQQRYRGRVWAIRQMRTIAAMSSVVDEGVGRIVEALRDLGELDNTLIVYLSDNGPDGFHAQVGAAPLTGAKRFLTEGGTSTHLILHWPDGILRPGRIERRPGHVIDLMPTFLELAGAPVPEGQRLDGKSLVPVIEGKPFEGHEMLFWELYSQQAAIEDGRWKYLLDDGGRSRLYDLQADPAETVDLAAKHPEKLHALVEKYQLWADANNVMPPGEVEAWRKANLQERAKPKKRRNKT